jgi:hypothetical protein
MLDDWKDRFLDVLKKTQNVKISVERAGVGRSTVYEQRAKNPQFKNLWDEARRGVIRGAQNSPPPIFFA